MKAPLILVCASVLLALAGCGLLEGGSVESWDSPSPTPFIPKTADERPDIAPPARAAEEPRGNAASSHGLATLKAGEAKESKRDAEYRQFLIDRGWSTLLDEPKDNTKRLSELSKDIPPRAGETPRNSYEYRTMVPFWVGEAEARKDPKIEAAARKLVTAYLESERGFGSRLFGMNFPSPRIHSLSHYHMRGFGFDRSGEKCFQVTILATMRRGDRQDWKTLNIYLMQGIPSLRTEDYDGLEIRRVSVSDR